MQIYRVAEVFSDSNVFFQYYTWLNDNMLYITFNNQNVNQTVRAILHLNNLEGVPTTDLKLINSTGYLVNSLPFDKNKVLYAKKLRNNRYHLYHINISDLENNNFDRNDKLSYNLSSSSKYYSDNQGEVLFASNFLDDAIDFWILNKEEKKWIKFYTHNDMKVKFTPVGFIGNNKLAVLSDKYSDLISLYEFDLKTKEFGGIIYQHEKYDLTDAEIDRNTFSLKRVDYIDHGRLESLFFSDNEKRLDKLLDKAFPDMQKIVISENKNSNKSIIKVFSSTNPGEYYLFDSETLTAKVIAYSSEDIFKYKRQSSKIFTVETSDGHSIEAIFTQPEKKINNQTLLVIPHGGPIGIRDYDGFDLDTQYFVSRGFSTLKVNFRGSKGFGKDFENKGRGQFGKIIEQDITAAVNHIKKKYQFKNTCSMGSSYGGYSATMLAIIHPKDYDCVIAKFGIYDLPLLFSQTNLNLNERARGRIERVVGEMRDELWEVSPFYLLDNLKVPLLLIAGKKDEIAHFEQSKRMEYRLSQLSKDYETIFYENAGHGHSNWFGDKFESAYVDDFIRRKLEISKLKGENLKDIQRDEALLLADGFEDGSFIEKKPSVSFKYYRKAADLGSPRAQFNIGAYYHRGELVSYDLKKAENWYLKASNNGYAPASLRLGEMYADGKLGKSKISQALDMFEKAKQQKHEFAELSIAKYNCQNTREVKGFEDCFDILKLNEDKNNVKFKHYKDERIKRNNILDELAWDINVYKNGLVPFKQLLKELFEVNVFDVRANIKEYGIVEVVDSNYGYGRSPKVVFETSSIEAKKGQRFGVNIEFDSNEGWLHKGGNSIVKIKWTTPNLINQFGQPIEPEAYLSYVDLGKDNLYSYLIENDWELVEGDWLLEIQTLDGKKLYEKKFTTYFSNQ